jgi:acyl transferase domain-containing protein
MVPLLGGILMPKNKTSQVSKIKSTSIAIIGMSAVFPKSSNVTEYWNNILNKIDAIIEVPSSRWNIEDYFDPNPSASDKTYCKRGGFIPDIDFDPAEFGLPPNILEATDVSQLLSLVVARDCLEDAGYGDSREYSRANVGVILGFVGIGSKAVMPLMSRLQYPVWDKVLKTYGLSDEIRTEIIEKFKLAYPKWEENSFPGSIGNVVSGRIANRFDLGGTNCVVDAACASSLAAIRMASAELIEGRADMMITGGVDTDNSIGTFMCFSKTPAFSKGEHVRTFDKDSDGMMAGEGIGMVMLKRLDDAERDDDRIYAVIRGIGSSSDGRYKSIYAPRPDGQSLALQRAYAEAGYSPATVGLIEAHGTGTMAGDPAEFQGLNAVFSEGNPRKQYIALGSVKSQIAHTKGAAGVASLIKAALSLHNKILPATINVKVPNPKLNILETPFYLNTETRPWFRSAEYPRRAGVSSFGFGGTNFHVALEEYESEHKKPYRKHQTARMFLVHANDPVTLAFECERWLERLNSDKGPQVLNELASLSVTSRPTAYESRIGFVAIDLLEAQTKFKTAIELIKSNVNEDSGEHPSGVYYRKNGVNPVGKVVALFPGQGSQYLNMGIESAINFPDIRECFAAMDSRFISDGQHQLTDTVFPIPFFTQEEKDIQSKQITATEFAQPAIGTLSMGFFKVLQNAGLSIDFAAGHSFGELTALWASGVLSDQDYLFLAKARGKAMAPPANDNFDAGTMLAVKGNIDQLQSDIADFHDVILANWNSNSQVVLAGPRNSISDLQNILVEKGYSVVALDVSAAFHTPLVGHAQKPFFEAINKVQFSKPSIPVFSNSTGSQYDPEPEKIKKILGDHILNPVKFKSEIEEIYSAGGMIFIEIGPKNVLTNLVNNILDGKLHWAVAINPNAKKDSDRQLREAVTQLCVLGLNLQNFDPYGLVEPLNDQIKKSTISIKLNGGSYLSEKTRSAFEKVLSEKNDLHLSTTTSEIHIPVTDLSNSSIEKQVIPEKPTNSESLTNFSISHFQEIQQETLRVHSQYLENDAEYTRLFGQLTQQELTLLNSNSPSATLEQINAALQTLERSISQFHQHQADSLRIHENYLSQQADLLKGILHLQPSSNLQDSGGRKPLASPIISTSSHSIPIDPLNPPSIRDSSGATPQNGNGHTPATSLPHEVRPNNETNLVKPVIDMDVLKTSLLDIVSEKTGYPIEMLELDMDMEADLGIDSIKRVEIMGAMQSKFPQIPQIDASALAETRTLGHIITFMADTSTEVLDGNPQKHEIGHASADSGTTEKIVMPPGTNQGDSVMTTLLEIVSEKTGYPTEMLELDMDMEADLGIDSIKRVEILGAMQELFPTLPQVDAAILSELRTLRQITESMSITTNKTQMDISLPDKISPNNQVNNSSSKDKNALATEDSFLSKQSSLENITKSLIDIVSEKTGYPTEMLDLTMDMEADLGIDSIKRVEILGAMQDMYPDLPKIDSTVLAEFRTLEQIIASFSDNPTNYSPAETSEEIPFPIEKTANEPLYKGVVNLKSLPLPDHIKKPTEKDQVTLVLADGSPLTKELVNKLIQSGHKVGLLSLPKTLCSKNNDIPVIVKQFEISHVSEEAIEPALRSIGETYGPVSNFIHLDQISVGSPDSSEKAKEINKAVFLIAKYLKEPLTLAGYSGQAAFITVSRLDGQFGLSMNNAFEPVNGGLFGLTKTLNLEWENVFCRAIDIEPGMNPDLAADCIIAEFHDPNRLISEVAYNKNGRFTLSVDLPEIMVS